MAQIQFRPDEQLAAELQERAGETFVPSPSLVAQRDLGRYYLMLRAALPTFSMEEAMLIVDAMNGIILEPMTIQLLWANIADAVEMDGLDQKWHVDGKALIERLRGLSRIEHMALFDAIERAWNSTTYRIANMEERIRKVGLVKE